ncbi:MAG TPA: type II toxin-antitoxin system RelE/ParE family toxin [Deltaproteobacteria bacterium]|nr:type II toxin-antitoxin system RelE/ParE family toxin [Deltaproteobacteria bacterium]HQI80355.1 type II toxin-antitoxin system RelE/ParE family toxin [Deltaproteobacteria bacterium]
MPYVIKFTQHAARAFRKLPRDVQTRVSPAIDALKDDPRPSGSEKLKGADDVYRVRVGDYRILYEVRDKELVVCIIEAGHRRQMYRRSV